MADQFKARTLKRKNVKGLALNATPKPASKQSEFDAQVSGTGGSGGGRTDTLEIGLEFRLDLRSEDLIPLKDLGAGNGGSVSKVMHGTTKVVMARKIIRVDAKENVRKQILRELQVGHDCNCPHIVTFYGAFQNDARDIVMCMEYMDCGSLDRISKDFGPVRVDVLGKITESVLAGLVYLYETHRIMHRDIKPSNILVNSKGNIKLCDFGVATETVNSIADTFVGTSTYMAPERIQGGAYTVRSDVWSVGLTVMELAVGRFPFDNSDASAGDRASIGPMGILDLLQQIVHEPAPKLPKSDAFPPILHEFVAKCLLKKPEERPTPRELFDKDAFLQAGKRTPVDLQEWAVSMMDRHNRKSYLAPAAPKTLKEESPRANMAQKSHSSKPQPPTSSSSRPQQQASYRPANHTPTSEDIPLNIANDTPSSDASSYWHYQQQQQQQRRRHNTPPSSSSLSRHARPTRSPVAASGTTAPIPPHSSENLSLDSNDDNILNYASSSDYHRANRPPRHMLREPTFNPAPDASASHRPFLESRNNSYSSSSSRPSRSGYHQSGAMPIRTVLPPGSGSSQTPVSAGGSWRGQTSQSRNRI